MLGFIFIGGWGNVKKSYAGSVGQLRCPSCNQVREWKIYDVEKRATAYFIPVWTYASERVVICSGCGAGSKVTNVEIAELRKRSKVEALNAAGGLGVRGALEQWVEGFSMRGPNPELDDWLNRLVGTAAGVGYAETRRRRGGRLYRVPVLATGEFRMGSTRLTTRLLASEEEAAILESRMDAVKSVAIRDGRFQAIAHGRQVSTAADPQRLPEGSMGRWVATASAVGLTSDGGESFLGLITAGLNTVSLSMNIGAKEAGLPRRPAEEPAGPVKPPTPKPPRQRAPKQQAASRGLRQRLSGLTFGLGEGSTANWADQLSVQLASHGYVEMKRCRDETYLGMRAPVSLLFTREGTEYAVHLLDTPKRAHRFRDEFMAQPPMVEAFQKSQVKSTVFRRTMLMAYDTNGVEPSDFARWVAATMHVNPPQ